MIDMMDENEISMLIEMLDAVFKAAMMDQLSQSGYNLL